MKKKLLALLLAATMVASLFAGCGGNEEPDNSENKGSEVVGGSEESESEELEDPDEIVIALMTLAPVDPSLTEHVEEELNKMFLEKINVKADIMWFQAAEYGEKVPMMLNGNEQLDLIMLTPVPSTSYGSYLAANQLMDIAPYIEEYGDAIKASMGQYLGSTSVGDATYAVGNLACLYGYLAINMRADVLRDLSLYEKAANMKSFEEYEEILKEVVAKTDYVGISNSDAEGSIVNAQPYMAGDGAFADAYFVDVIGDSNQYTYVDEATNTVKCYFENENYVKALKMVRRWYQEGLVYEDAAITDEYAANFIKSGVSFSYMAGAEFGGIANLQANAGCEMLEVAVCPKQVGAAAFQKFGFAVPASSEYPEAAVKVINLLHGDADVANTMTWGVKGVDWEVNEEGLAVFPEGKDATTAYHTADFLFGNVTIIQPWEGVDADIREQQIEANKNAAPSPYMGMALDTSKVSAQIAAVKAVVDQYKPSFNAGVLDVDAEYQNFIDALYAAGMQDILDEYQAQLDAWLGK